MAFYELRQYKVQPGTLVSTAVASSEAGSPKVSQE